MAVKPPALHAVTVASDREPPLDAGAVNAIVALTVARRRGANRRRPGTVYGVTATAPRRSGPLRWSLPPSSCTPCRWSTPSPVSGEGQTRRREAARVTRDRSQ